MNIGVISRNIGIALTFNAMFMFLSAIVAAMNNFDSSFSPLLLSSIITCIFGVFPLIFVRRHKDISNKEGLCILLFSWVLCCLFGMLPYVLWGGEFSPVNAWFESASGITTTGATILNDIESLPKGLLFWRSSTHYIGGLGVVVFILLILPSFSSVRFKISKMEISDVSKSNYKFRSNKVIRVVISVYLALTLAMTLALKGAGMSWFDAVNHAFSAVATGGFSTKNLSIGAYDSYLIYAIVIFFMILSSLHFGLLYSAVVSRSSKLFKDPVTKFYLTTIVIATLVVAISLRASSTYDNFFTALGQSFFHVASTISSTGFAVSDTSVWPIFSILVLLFISLQCGCSGSTSGGMKADRVWILFKASRAQLLRIVHPNAVISIKSGGHVIDRDMVTSVALFVLLTVFVTFVCSLVYAICGEDFLEALSTSISMMNNIGPAFGRYGSLSNFSDMNSFGKIVMGIQMIIGRLGVFSVLIIFTIFRKRS